jgi:hypothetical protein
MECGQLASILWTIETYNAAISIDQYMDRNIQTITTQDVDTK